MWQKLHRMPPLSLPPLMLLPFLLLLGLHASGGNSEAVGFFHQLDASDCPTAKLLTVVVAGPQNVTVQLLMKESSRDFIPPDAVAHGKFFDLRRRPCFYQGGRLGDPEDTTAVGKQVDGWFSATFGLNGVTFEVPSQRADSLEFQAHQLPPVPRRFSCGLTATNSRDDRHGHSHGHSHSHSSSHSNSHSSSSSSSSSSSDHSRVRRAVNMDLHSPLPEAQQTYIPLVLVGDEHFVNGTGGNFLAATERLWEIGNYINNLYKPIGVNVVTVRVTVLFGDPLGLGKNESGTDPAVMLNNFMLYRMRSLTDVTHSVAHLVSGLRMTGANVGLAHRGLLCQFAKSGGVNTDTSMSGSAFNVAVTVTHELGHNLGMEHDPDTDPCGCTDPQGCIMTAVGTDVNPVRFSNCSVVSYRQFSVANGLGYCLVRPPTRAMLTEAAPKCGNRILDAGEDCDCGLPAYCNNTCCNASTCKFTPGASCASGQCCNTTTCAPVARGAPCRVARGTCDLPEYCNGTSEWCPEFDDYKIDGTDCATNPSNATQVLAHCQRATCVTRDQRCQALFLESDMRAASDAASVRATEGNAFGYCAYSPMDNPLTYNYVACTSQNQRCGTLYCIGTMPDGFPTPRWKGMEVSQALISDPITVGGSALAYARIDMRPSGYRDPGLVPDGAECGPGRMCVNSKCESVLSVMQNITTAAGVGTLPNCNGRGTVTQSGLCFCNYGFRPPNCVDIGYGGSMTNQPVETGNITTAGPTTTTPTTQTTATTRLEFTTLDQKRDDFWMFVGIGIGIGVAVILACIFAVWLFFWCRRNNTDPYTGGLQHPVSVTDASAAIAFRNCGDPRSYPMIQAGDSGAAYGATTTTAKNDYYNLSSINGAAASVDGVSLGFQGLDKPPAGGSDHRAQLERNYYPAAGDGGYISAEKKYLQVDIDGGVAGTFSKTG